METLKSGIWCPDVFGPWYAIKWVQGVLLALIILVFSNLWDNYRSEDGYYGGEGYSEPFGWDELWRSVFGPQ